MLKKARYLFSPYVNNDERSVGVFFARLSHSDPNSKTINSLTHILQKNIIAQNLWCESKYKGYKYLDKYTRKKLYKNAELIIWDFNEYIKKTTQNYDKIKLEINALIPDYYVNKQDLEKLEYLRCIMQYLSPANQKYQYRVSSSFGELLKDPTSNILKGDCNQIVTLYIYLFSLRYNILDLNLTTYPGHVALHFKGIDIEATNGSFANYSSKGRQILPIYEIATINLMDTTDSYFKTHSVNSLATLQAARLAYVISSQTEVATQNLKIAYNNAVVELAKTNNYKDALYFAKQASSSNLKNYVAKKAVQYYLNNNNFALAKKYCTYADNHTELLNIIAKSEAVFYYNKRDYVRALSIFKQHNDTAMVKNCYIALFAAEQKKLGIINTADDIRKNRKIIFKMSDYAKKANDEQLVRYVNNLQKYL